MTKYDKYEAYIQGLAAKGDYGTYMGELRKRSLGEKYAMWRTEAFARGTTLWEMTERFPHTFNEGDKLNVMAHMEELDSEWRKRARDPEEDQPYAKKRFREVMVDVEPPAVELCAEKPGNKAEETGNKAAESTTKAEESTKKTKKSKK